MSGQIRLHAVLKGSLANGPKRAAVVWVQGCPIKCPGCCNPKTHDTTAGYTRDVDDLCVDITKDDTIGGFTISGGEPLAQLDSVLHLVTVVHRLRPELCIVLFTGYEDPLNNLTRSERFETLEDRDAFTKTLRTLVYQVDVMVEGGYDAKRPGKDPLMASANQKVWFPTGRYGPNDLIDIPRVEVLIHEDGTVVETGVGGLLSSDRD